MFTTLGYLYNQIHPVVLGVSDPTNRWNRMYYAKPVKLHKGVDNPVKFKIRNNNQKDVTLTGSTFTLTIVDSYTNQEILSRTLDIENASTGMLATTITEEDLNNLDAVRYHYGIRMVNSSGVQYPIYVDDNYSAAGVIEVYGDAYPGPVPSVQPTIGAYNSGVSYTSVVEVTNTANGNNTAAYYLTGFSGTVTVQGYLDNTGSVSETDYIDIVSNIYTNQSGVVYSNFTGLFSGIRFKIELTAGTLNKILYKY